MEAASPVSNSTHVDSTLLMFIICIIIDDITVQIKPNIYLVSTLQFLMQWNAHPLSWDPTWNTASSSGPRA